MELREVIAITLISAAAVGYLYLELAREQAIVRAAGGLLAVFFVVGLIAALIF